MKKGSLVLGIETSCDETSIAILQPPRTILANIISSSLEKHRPFGGVVPEIACRYHLENIHIVLEEALKKAQIKLEDIGLVAVTHAPGLIGALLIGVSFAKTLSYALNVPLIGVNHLEGHLESNKIDHPELTAPFLGVVVSGGHTNLVRVMPSGKILILGGTIDDAVGEAFDKTAKIIGLGYPGGPVIDQLARKGDPTKIKFTCAPLPGTYDFSYSGIKTAVLNYTRKHPDFKKNKADIAASFQKSAIDIIVTKALKAAKEYKLTQISVGGGVSANSYLRKQLTGRAYEAGLQVYFPKMEYTVDNGAMIAMTGYLKHKQGKSSDLKLQALPSLGW